MEFLMVKKTARFLDPFNQFNEGMRECEIRLDPLTGRRSRILFFPIKEMVRQDIDSIVERSKGFCPFCPDMVEKITPKFHPELLEKERYQKGRAICFPNAFPYDENGAVTVISDLHYIPLDGFTADLLSDAIGCCVDFLEDLIKRQPIAIYQSINWNYLPLAGSSIIHPHLQITASTSPTNYYEDVVESLKQYEEKYGEVLFTDLISEERKRGERFVAENDDLAWFTSFAPMGAFDLIGVFKNVRKPADISGEALVNFVKGILNFTSFIDSMNIASFNMSLYFMLEFDGFYPHVRLCPRVSIPPLDTCEINYMKMLHGESMSTMRPEDIAVALRAVWKD